LALNHLPQVFCHYDFQRRNLFICKTENHQDELVAIDWALCGWGALGGDMHHLIIISAIFFDFAAEYVQDLDTTAFAAYLDGLRSTGWVGDANQVRLGYCIWAAAFNATIIPTVAAYFTSDDRQLEALRSFGVSGTKALKKWSLMLDYCLDCADEARMLMKQLGIS
jgi:Ecdysteroid kinase-like family